jgi:transposase
LAVIGNYRKFGGKTILRNLWQFRAIYVRVEVDRKIIKKIDSWFIRIKNLIDEVHKKVAKWLTTEDRVIFLPTFESSLMVAKSGKKKRKLNSKTVRKMLNWAPYRFKQTLKFHALKRGATVIDVTEEYNSKMWSYSSKIRRVKAF